MTNCQTLWLKPTQTYPTVLEVRGQNESHGAKIKMSAGLVPLESPEENLSPYTFELAEVLAF